MDTITLDGTEVPVRPITLLITDDHCAADPILDGHVEAGTWWNCTSCHTSHQVHNPVHTFITPLNFTRWGAVTAMQRPPTGRRSLRQHSVTPGAVAE